MHAQNLKEIPTSFFEKYFRLGFMSENYFYSYLDKLCEAYSGGHFELASGVAGTPYGRKTPYEFPCFSGGDKDKVFEVLSPGYQTTVKMSGEALCVVACIFLLNHGSHKLFAEGKEDLASELTDRCEALKDFAESMKDSSAIFMAID